MADANDVVYSYEGDTTGIMDSLDTISEGIQGLIEDINALVDASSGLGEFEGIFEEIAGIFEEVGASASEVTDGIAEMGASAEDASTQLTDLQDAVDSLGGALAEDTALIDSLNETIVNLQAQVDMLTASEAGATASTDSLSVSVTGLKAAQGPLMMLGMAGIAAGASMYDMGSKAEDALNQVQALAGVGSSDMATYTSQLEDQATQFGETLDQEAQGLFYVTSAGFKNADAMKVLAQSVMDAKAGNVDLEVSSKALTGVLNAYGASADQSSQYNDLMMKAVTDGTQTFGDFASAIGKAASEGNAAHISFNQVAAAESTLTDHAMTARNASQDLTTMMRGMDSDIGKTATTAKSLGLNFNEAAFKSMDLQHQMGYLQDITKGNQTELSKLVGGSAGLLAFNDLMTKNADGTSRFTQVLDDMKNSSGSAAQAFATSQDTIGAHWAKVQASLSVISYKALEALAPTINAVADAFGKAADFLSQHMDIVMPILAGFAALIGVVVAMVVGPMLSALGGLSIVVGTVSAPFWAVALAVVAAVAAIVYAVEHWGDIVGWLKGVWAATPGFFSGLWQNIQNGVSGVGKWIGDKWKDATASVVDSFDWLYNHNYYFKSLADAAKTATTDAANFLKGAWQTASTDTVNAWNDLTHKATQLWDEISTPFKNAWSQYIAPPLNSLWNSIKGLWDGFVTNAENLGKNLVQSIASGISSKAGEAGQAAQNIGDRIATLLGFHNIAGMAQKSGGTIVAAVRGMGTNMVAAAQQAGAGMFSALQGAGANIRSWWNGVVAGFEKSPIGGAIIKTLQDAFGQIGQQFGQIGQTLKTQLGDALSGVKTSLGQVGDSFKLVWQQIQPGLQLVGGALSTAWKQVSGAMAQVGQIISSSIGPFWKSLQQQLAQVASILGGALSTAWKQVSGAMTQVGQIIATSIGPFLKSLQQQLAQVASIVGGALSTAWKALSPIFAQIGGAVGGQLLNVLKMIGAILGGIVLIAISLVLGAIVGLAKGFATLVQGIAMVIGGIVKVFSGVMQIASGIVAFLVDLFTGHFNKLGADLGTIWHGIVTMFSGLWDVLKGIFTAGIGTIVSFISGFIGTIIQFFTNLWDKLVGHSIIPDMINGIVNWFEQLPTRALTFVEHLVNSLTTTLGGLGAKALTWAGDMISQFVQGIENGIGAVGNAVQKIASKISSFLHFSKPDVGPLADVDSWMPDFGNLLAKDLQNQIPKLESAARGIAQSVANVANPSTLPQGPNPAASGLGSEQAMQYLAQISQGVQGMQRQQVPPPTSANLGAITQNFGGMNLHGVNDPVALAQELEKIMGQQFIYSQRGALFNN